MEATPGKEVEGRPKTSGGWLRNLASRLDIPFLIVAAVVGFVAVSSDAWWTVRATASDSILQVSVSPFFVRIIGLGVPSSVPYADTTGILARVGLGLTAVALAWQGVFHLSVWRKPVLWLSLSVIAGVFLNFVLLLHSTQLVLFEQYGVVPQLTGELVIPGVVLGTDLVAYSSPTVVSSLGLGFYAGLVGLLFLGGSEFARYILFRRLGLDSSGFLAGLTGAFFSPPYQHAWLTSNDQGLNPLKEDPDKLTDDQLALSFERLMKALRPGALVSVILPPWARKLSDRLVRVVGWTGFELENSQVIFRAPGRPENELVFRKPTVPEQAESEPNEQAEIPESPEPPSVAESPASPEYTEMGDEGELDDILASEDSLSNDLYQPGRLQDSEGPPVGEHVEDPVWAQPDLDPQELEILSSAVKLMENAGEPIPYRDLIDHVYLDMIQRNIRFESGNQIEVVLLQHVGKELSIFEHLDETGTELVRSWWLGEGEVQTEDGTTKKMRGRLSDLGKKVRNVRGLLGSRKTIPTPETEEDAPNSFLDDDSS